MYVQSYRIYRTVRMQSTIIMFYGTSTQDKNLRLRIHPSRPQNNPNRDFRGEWMPDVPRSHSTFLLTDENHFKIQSFPTSSLGGRRSRREQRKGKGFWVMTPQGPTKEKEEDGKKEKRKKVREIDLLLSPFSFFFLVVFLLPSQIGLLRPRLNYETQLLPCQPNDNQFFFKKMNNKNFCQIKFFLIESPTLDIKVVAKKHNQTN